MFRFLPPHLMALIALLLVVVWLMLLRQFRQSPAMQRFVAELFGDETPETALRAFDAAKARLTDHLNDRDLDDQTRQQIETALGTSPHQEAIGCSADEASV